MAGIHVELGQSIQRDRGAYPSICLNNNNTVVQVNKSAGLVNHLWHHVGKVDIGGEISWGKPFCYDSGLSPRVAINNCGTVVEVHESLFHRDIYCRVGVVNTAKQEIQ